MKRETKNVMEEEGGVVPAVREAGTRRAWREDGERRRRERKDACRTELPCVSSLSSSSPSSSTCSDAAALSQLFPDSPLR